MTELLEVLARIYHDRELPADTRRLAGETLDRLLDALLYATQERVAK